LNFPNGIWHRISFHMRICHMYFIFGEVYFKGFGLFLIRLFVFLSLSFKCSLYILNSRSLYFFPVNGLASLYLDK
jgi:hypothetical protein